MTTTNDLDAIRKLTDAATEEPWFATVQRGKVPVVSTTDQALAVCGSPGRGAGKNAEFIAAARTHVPDLCDEVEQLRTLLTQSREQAAELIDEQASHQATLRNQSVLSAEVQQLRAELEKVRAQLAAANRRNDGYKADERYAGRAALTEYRDANHRHNGRAPGWCICGEDWDDEGCTEHIGLTEAAQLYTGEKAGAAQ